MSQQYRPVLKLKTSAFDKIIEGLGLLTLLFIWIFLFITYSSIPESIPLHFTLSGMVDSFGHRSGIYNLPAVATALYLLLTIANCFPQYFNYLRPITPQNAERRYTIATRMLRYLKVFLVMVFAALVLITVNY